MRVAIIEDEQRLARALQKEFELEHHVADVFRDVSSARARLESSGKLYDLIILDLMLPDGDGSEVCSALRATGVETPILVLSAKDSTEDKISLLEKGADDFLTKPFDLEELLARSNSLNRRASGSFVDVEYNIGDVRILPKQHELYRGTKRVPLTRREFDIVLYLVRNRGRIVSREELYTKIWQESRVPTTNIVDVHVRNTRKKIDDAYTTKLIETIHGVGYRIT